MAERGGKKVEAKRRAEKSGEKVISSFVMISIVLLVFAASVATVSAPNPPGLPEVTEIVVTASPESIPADGSSTSIITATVTNWTNTETPDNFTIYFGFVGEDLGAHISTKYDTYNKTDSEGRAYATLTAGLTPGTVTIKAWWKWNESVFNTTTVTLLPPPEIPEIVAHAPESPVKDNEGAVRTFSITVNQSADVTWLINSTVKQINEGVPAYTPCNYTNESAVAGVWNVSALVENPNGTTMQTWIWKVSRLERIEVLPSEATLQVGDEMQFNAIAYDQFNETMSGIIFTWSSSNETVGIVDANGLFTAKYPGFTFVNATAPNGVKGTALVSVIYTPEVTTIMIEPAEATIYEGDTQEFTATAYDQIGKEMPEITNFTWNCTNPTVGTVSPTTGKTTVFTALKAGVTTVIASAEGVSNTSVVHVLPRPDLVVEEITPNPDCDGYLFANESNEICAVIKNNGSGAALAFNVSFVIGEFSEVVRVEGLDSGAKIMKCVIDTTERAAGEQVTINISADCDDEISELNETNNWMKTSTAVVNNGYKGKRYTGGGDISTWRTYELHGSVLYSVGDSYYLSAGSYPHWTAYTVNWSASDLPVPAGATVVEARLYVIYTWDKAGVMPDEVSLTFNGQMQTLEAHYSDRKGYGRNDYPYGMLVYNVTDIFNPSGNTAILNNMHPGGGNVSIRGMLLVVIYADDSEPKRTIFMNEGFDMLYGGSSKCTTPEEATAYAPFSGLTVDTANVKSAKLITVAPGAGPNEGDLIFNGHKWTDVWNFAGSSQIGINETDVTAYLNATENEARFQSSEDWMEASNAFLVVTKKAAPICVPSPFLIDGYVFYANGAACNGPIVSITNLNTGKTWEAETNATSNYYQLNLTSCVDVNASEVLRFDVSSPDGTRTNTTERTVTQADIDAGGLFNFNITLGGIHDINITTDYEGAVNGIKITRDGTDVVGPDENLTIGETYKIRYKLVNEGDFNETVHVTVRIANESWSMPIGEHNYSLDAGESNTYKDEWDTSGLAPGNYTITVNASIPEDKRPDNNKRTRKVTLMLPSLGSIIGRITYTCNETGIADVHVNLMKDGEVLDTTTTDNTGYYEFIGINPGDYYVNASKPGFWDNSTSVTIIAGETATVNMMLWIIGDLDNDGKSADRDDVKLMLKAYLGYIEPDYRYDLDKDGSPADRDDVKLMLKAYLGYIVLSDI